MNIYSKYTVQNLCNELVNCSVCPHTCNTDRTKSARGFCRANAGISIASICIHKGEEPAISGTHGICNVFFSHCNMQCIYCQNYQISHNGISSSHNRTIEDVTDEIIKCLDEGCESVGFVSASHMIPQMVMIINSLKNKGKNPIFVYNTNSYDKVETLRKLEGVIDVYLADFKYAADDIGYELSGVKDYPSVALKAIKEMYRQMGSVLITNDNGIAQRGLIIRHLVLPGYTENSIEVLRLLEKHFSTRLSISLMSQYYPIANVINHHKLNRKLTEHEYNIIVNEMELLGYENGWVQDLDSSTEYLPNFNLSHPFESA